MGYLTTDKKKVTAKTLLEMKAAGEKITQMTAYDFTTAGIIDAAGIDRILVGDSASNDLPCPFCCTCKSALTSCM